MAPAVAERVNTYVLLEEPAQMRPAPVSALSQYVADQLIESPGANGLPEKSVLRTAFEGLGIETEEKVLEMMIKRMADHITGSRSKGSAQQRVRGAVCDVITSAFGRRSVMVAGYIPGETVRIDHTVYQVSKDVDELTDLQIAEPVAPPFSHV